MIFAFWRESLLSFDPALEFFEIKPNIDKAGAEISVHRLKNPLVLLRSEKNPAWL